MVHKNSKFCFSWDMKLGSLGAKIKQCGTLIMISSWKTMPGWRSYKLTLNYIRQNKTFNSHKF